MLILGWYVLVETQSVVLLTLFASLFYIGTLVAPMFGMLGDRFGHRAILFGTRGTYMTMAATMATLALTGLLQPVHVFVIAAFTGFVRPSDIGVRSALVASTVPSNYLVGSMSISRMTADSARGMGAVVGSGLFVAYGMGPAYVVIACFYLAGMLLLFGVGPEPRSASTAAAGAPPRPSAWSELIEGMTYIWNTPRLFALMWLAFLVNLAAFPLVTGLMPYVAKDIYHTNQAGLGWLVFSMACGAIAGSLLLSSAGARLRAERVMLGAIVTWFMMLLVFAHVTSMSVGILCLLVIGGMQSLGMVALSIILMQTSAPQYRGRVMGVRMMAIYGHPLGMLAAGVLVARIGYPATATLYGLVGLALTLAIVLFWRAEMWRPREPAGA
jgi:predicted MFS family arabinose efflux permease